MKRGSVYNEEENTEFVALSLDFVPENLPTPAFYAVRKINPGGLLSIENNADLYFENLIKKYIPELPAKFATSRAGNFTILDLNIAKRKKTEIDYFKNKLSDIDFSGGFNFFGEIAELESYDFRARQYAPLQGTFLQRDPKEYEDSMNLFNYVGNQPNNRVDPLGLQKRT